MTRSAIWASAGLLAFPWAASGASDFGGDRVTDLPASLRVQAMGESMAALGGESAWAASNPAGLAWLSRSEITLARAALLGATSFDTVSFAVPRADVGALGLAVSRSANTGIAALDDHGESAGTVSASEMQVSLDGALSVGDLSVGASLSALRQQLPGIARTDFDLSVGAAYSLSSWASGAPGSEPGWGRRFVGRLAAGVAARHLVAAKFGGGPLLPASVALGLSHRTPFGKSSAFTVASDLERTEGATPRLHAGAEIVLFDSVAIRAGRAPELWTFGAGIRYGPARIEYAAAAGEAGLSHRASVALAFGPSLEQQRKSAALRANAERAAMAEQVRREIRGQLERESAAASAKALAEGKAALERGDFDGARAAYAKAQAWQPQNASAAQGLAEASRRETDQKKEEQEKAIGDALARARASLQSARPEDALEAAAAAEAILSIRPGDGEAKRILAAAKEKIKAAPVSLESGPRVSPEARAKFERGMSEFVAGHWEAAVESFLDGVRKADGKYPAASEYLALSMIRQRSAAPARQATRSADDDGRRKSASLYNEGVAHYVSGRLRKAVATWQEALRADPGNDAAARDLEQAQRKIRKMDEQQIPIPE